MAKCHGAASSCVAAPTLVTRMSRFPTRRRLRAHCRFDGRFVGDVAVDERGRPPVGPDAFHHLGSAVSVDVGHHDRGTVLRTCLRRCTPETRGASEHQCNLVLQLHPVPPGLGRLCGQAQDPSSAPRRARTSRLVGTSIPWRRPRRTTSPVRYSYSVGRPAKRSWSMEVPVSAPYPDSRSKARSASDSTSRAPSARPTFTRLTDDAPGQLGDARSTHDVHVSPRDGGDRVGRDVSEELSPRGGDDVLGARDLHARTQRLGHRRLVPPRYNEPVPADVVHSSGGHALGGDVGQGGHAGPAVAGRNGSSRATWSSPFWATTVRVWRPHSVARWGAADAVSVILTVRNTTSATGPAGDEDTGARTGKVAPSRRISSESNGLRTRSATSWPVSDAADASTAPTAPAPMTTIRTAWRADVQRMAGARKFSRLSRMILRWSSSENLLSWASTYWSG